MRFLPDADVPRSSAVVLSKFGHQVVDLRDISLGGAAELAVIFKSFLISKMLSSTTLGKVISPSFFLFKSKNHAIQV